MRGVVYKYTSPSNKVYIGQTKRERGRRTDFRSSQSYGGHRIDNARAKYGPENFTYEVLYEVENSSLKYVDRMLNEKEAYFIKKYKSDDERFGYNMSLGGVGAAGLVVSEETRRKLSASIKRRIRLQGHPLKGKKHRPDSIERMRQNTKKKYGSENPNYGWNPSAEVREKLRQAAQEKLGEKNPFYGRHHTDATKKKLREVFGKKVVQYHPETFEKIAEYDSAMEAAIAVSGKKKSHVDISKVCNRYVQKRGSQRITACGYRWKWKDDPDPTFPMAKKPSHPSKGHKLSKQHKEKLRKINSKRVKQINPDTGAVIAIHESATKAAQYIGHPCRNSDIGKMCNGKLQRSQLLGFRWEWE